MLVLGLDTALKSCSVAILRGADVLGDSYAPLEKGHAERLAPMVAETLRAAGVDARDLDRVGVVIGPGGFAGVRVGLAFARALAIDTKIGVIGVTSLEALAAGLSPPSLRAAVIDARRGQVYAGLYGEGEAPVVAPFVTEPKDALERLMQASAGAPVALTGDGAALLGALPAGWMVDPARSVIDAKIVARLAAQAPLPKRPPPPLYLRPPDATPSAPSAFARLLGGSEA